MAIMAIIQWEQRKCLTCTFVTLKCDRVLLKFHFEMKWCILLKLSAYPIEKQETNIITYIAPHNFIRNSAMHDANFERCVRYGDQAGQATQDIGCLFS